MIRKLQYGIALYKREVEKGEYGCEQPLYLRFKEVKGSFSHRDYERGLKNKEYGLAVRDRITVYISVNETITEGDGIGIFENFYEIMKIQLYHSHMKLTAERREGAQWI